MIFPSRKTLTIARPPLPNSLPRLHSHKSRQELYLFVVIAVLVECPDFGIPIDNQHLTNRWWLPPHPRLCLIFVVHDVIWELGTRTVHCEHVREYYLTYN